ncbi:GTP 3',8-cyclase MoaA [Desulforegula conservatrix]|uniref:GTP 3',8-cyclase MoaA n=1 Tax=Desulforegula conservatrix TaxID=153026 RepID=UPI00041C4E8B|nr:GTP 3',8-cyclase MoaA [Desulforegula conservatrix]
MKIALTDRHGRQISYLRLSVTDRCNLRCVYCVPPEGRQLFAHDEILRYEEMLRIVNILAVRGIHKIRITGGEPLVRKDLPCLVREIKKIPGIREVCLTTNGVLLADMTDDLKQAGIDRINISLDSLKSEVFHSITGMDRLPSVLSGIDSALKAGMSPVKINAVPMTGINNEEIESLAELSFQKNIHVRFIEEMPVGIGYSEKLPPLSSAAIRERLESRWGSLIPVFPSSLDGPARRFQIPGAKGEVGFISSMTRHFCGTCNRIRLTAVGEIRPCLLNDATVDIKKPMRNGADDSTVARLIERVLMRKGLAHEQIPLVSTQMVSIGG